MPDGSTAESDRRGVVLLLAEDGLSDTVRPRFDAAGGDATRVVVLAGAEGEAEPRGIVIPEDCGVIEAVVRTADAGLLVIDPLMSFLSPRVSTRTDAEVRRALDPLHRLAARQRCTVLLVGTNRVHR